MSGHWQPDETSQEIGTGSPRRGRRRGRLLALIGAILLLATALFWVRGVPAWWARRTAVELLHQGAVTAALDQLGWAKRFAPHDGRADLIRASCLRRRRQPDLSGQCLRVARENGAPPELIQREARLASLQAGDISPKTEAELVAMVEGGASPWDVYGAFVLGCLQRGDLPRAQRFLQAWNEDSPEEADVAYLEGLCWASAGNGMRARECMETAVRRQPRHELARAALAQLLEQQGDIELALDQRLELARRSPSDEETILNLARLLRRLGRADDARRVTAAIGSEAEVSDEARWELGEIALELGDYQGARSRFLGARLSGVDGSRGVLASVPAIADRGDTVLAEVLLEKVTTRAAAESLEGNAYDAGQVFAQLNGVYDRIQRTTDLRARLQWNPSDGVAARQLQALSASPVEVPAETGDGKAESGAALYARHCAVCHGDNGNGNGRAARHLYPRPKNFRSGNFRLVSTINAVPALRDLETTVQRGMPGTSMSSFTNLGKEQVSLLVQEVVRLYHDGIREQVLRWAIDETSESVDQEVRETIGSLATPGSPAGIPPIGPSLPEAIARGKQVYAQSACFHCHGEDGRGPGDTLLVDEEGRLTSSRDLTCEPFKGGVEPQAVYLRILLGMPGTPHPSSAGLAQNEIADLVHFCLSLRQTPEKVLTSYEQWIRAHRPGMGRPGNNETSASDGT
ncbi:MAG: c-type cytochrome [Thermoguttaceae bacterium]